MDMNSGIEGCETPKNYVVQKRITTKFYDPEGSLVSTEVQLIEEPEVIKDRVLSVKAVDHDQVDALIDIGYQPKEYYAKSIVMVLTESGNQTYQDSLIKKMEDQA